ncbi:phloem protein 2-A1 [Prunus dulcis]|uniref:Phloem protein 2-A1 n=1 Tax=Prunus dulcis TaxID=3755 RepID=A0A4Y1R4H8_PRUDU|nr:phloem protein 2-A1 [Prunus dulcis]
MERSQAGELSSSLSLTLVKQFDYGGFCERRIPGVQENGQPNDIYYYQTIASEDNVEVVKLSSVCFLNVRGQFKMSELSAGVVYEIAYKVKLTNGAFGWELPVTVKIRFPDGTEQKRQYSLFQKLRGQWIELSGGSFEVKEKKLEKCGLIFVNMGDTGREGLSSKVSSSSRLKRLTRRLDYVTGLDSQS